VGTHRLASRWAGDVVGNPLFSGAVGSVQLCGVSVKGYHIQGLLTGSVHRVYVDWYKKHTCHVYQIFPCMMYIDSNRRDSQI
jgi:hypothetical protein